MQLFQILLKCPNLLYQILLDKCYALLKHKCRLDNLMYEYKTSRIKHLTHQFVQSQYDSAPRANHHQLTQTVHDLCANVFSMTISSTRFASCTASYRKYRCTMLPNTPCASRSPSLLDLLRCDVCLLYLLHMYVEPAGIPQLHRR